jgi:hypothetical protein
MDVSELVRSRVKKMVLFFFFGLFEPSADEVESRFFFLDFETDEPMVVLKIRKGKKV